MTRPYIPVQSSTAQYSLVPTSASQYCIVQPSTTQYSPVPPSKVQYRTVQFSIAQKAVCYIFGILMTRPYIPVQPSTGQYSPVQHSIAQNSPVPASTALTPWYFVRLPRYVLGFVGLPLPLDPVGPTILFELGYFILCHQTYSDENYSNIPS